jgi:Protein of unknown function (DUF3592)
MAHHDVRQKKMTEFYIFSLFCFALCGYGAWRYLRISAMRRWTRGVGRISAIEEVKRHTTCAGVALPYYAPKIRFDYEVNGRTYRSDKFGVHNFTVGMKGEITEILRGAKVGDEVEIFYSPDDPNEAILGIPDNGGVILAMFFGAGLWLLVLLIMISRK